MKAKKKLSETRHSHTQTVGENEQGGSVRIVRIRCLIDDTPCSCGSKDICEYMIPNT